MATIPETADSCSDAIALARQYLSLIEIGDTDLTASQLDAYPKSGAWGRKAWRALRALHDYADAKEDSRFNGDFVTYCDESPPGCTTIPTAWIASRESESTDNNPIYREARCFPVPPEVDDAELVYMAAHIKLEPGGRPAPRLHYFDDTGGTTGRVYVGYLGEHLPNDQTN